MAKYIDFDVVKSNAVYSRDLKEYVVPMRIINSLPKKEINDSDENVDYDDMLRVLFNRCMALTQYGMCMFCDIRDECEKRRSILNDREEE